MTWKEIKLITLQKMFAAEGSNIPTDESTEDYLAGMPGVANEALQMLCTAGRYILKKVEIAHYPSKNLLGEFGKFIHSLEEGEVSFEADGAHAYYFDFYGEGTLKMDNGITFLPNDRYLLENEKFRLYYTAAGEEAHNFIVVVEDNFSNSYELEFDFNNRNVKDDGVITVVPIGNFKPLTR